MRDETPTRYLGMTLRVYILNAETRERTYLPVSSPNPANASFNAPCSCPDCLTEQSEAESTGSPGPSAR